MTFKVDRDGIRDKAGIIERIDKARAALNCLEEVVDGIENLPNMRLHQLCDMKALCRDGIRCIEDIYGMLSNPNEEIFRSTSVKKKSP